MYVDAGKLWQQQYLYLETFYLYKSFNSYVYITEEVVQKRVRIIVNLRTMQCFITGRVCASYFENKFS